MVIKKGLQSNCLTEVLFFLFFFFLENHKFGEDVVEDNDYYCKNYFGNHFSADDNAEKGD